MAPESTNLALFDYFVRGGVFMWPLLLCSLVGVALIIYKIVVFAAANRGGEQLVDEVVSLTRNGDLLGAAATAGSSQLPVAGVLSAMLATRPRTREALRAEGQEAGERQLAQLEHGLPTLSTISTIAPLLGFLGTVSGMIRAFEAIAHQGMGDPGVVAAGIGEALITTATGLIVAIPCFVAYSYLVGRVNAFGMGMELAGNRLVQAVAEEVAADEVPVTA